MDEIGFIIPLHRRRWLLYFSGIGGHDSVIPVGQRIWIHGKDRVAGVIGRKAVHLLEEEERKKKPEIKDLWIDIGASSRAEVEGAGIQLGDVATFQVEFQSLLGDRATARGFDNKMARSSWRGMRLLKKDGGLDSGVGVYAVATVQEEIGLRGARTSAYWINAQSGLAVDVNHAVDYPGVSKTRYGASTSARGRASCAVRTRIRSYSRCFEMRRNWPAFLFKSTSTQGHRHRWQRDAAQPSRHGVGILGVALRYMHTPCEVLSLTDVENCAKLMAAYCRAVKPGTDFTPRLLPA